MKSVFSRIVSALLLIVLLLSVLPMSAFAESSQQYETIKDDVPVWSKASSSSTQKYKITRQGTVVEVVSSTTNSAGNLWHKLSNGYWVFSGNVKIHTHVGAACGESKTTYSQKNESVHIATTQMQEICRCGKSIGIQTLRQEESHSLNSQKTCTKCKFKMPDVTNLSQITKFETVKDAVPIRSSPTSKVEIDFYIEDEGTVIEVKAQAVNDSNNLWYQMTSGKWVYSGNVTVHHHQSVMCGLEKKTYTKKNESVHSVKSSIPEICKCGNVVSERVSWVDESHTLNGNYVCTKCGHQHTHSAYTVGASTFSYTQYNSSSHTKTTTTPQVCSCGYLIGTVDSSKTESHSFDSNDICSKCGYKKEHVHQVASKGSPTYTYNEKNSTSHTKITTTPQVCGCGYVITSVDNSKTESHSFDSNDICSECGYKKEHVHQVASKSSPTYTYKEKNSTSHLKITTTPQVCGCGYVITSVDNSKTESHSFDSKNTCVCGFQKHIHKLDKLKSIGSDYLAQDDNSHLFVDEVLEFCSCGSTINTKVVKTTQPHTFKDDKCVCGYSKETPPHQHKSIMCGKPFPNYTAKDCKSHYLHEVTPNLCECGMLIEFEKRVLKEEQHHFENGICKECGTEQSYDFFDVDLKQIADQAVKGNYSEHVTLAGIVAEVIVGEIPYVNLVADARDIFYSLTHHEEVSSILLNTVAIAPGVGIFKQMDNAPDISKGAKRIIKYFKEGTEQARKYPEGVVFTVTSNGDEYARFEKWAIAKADFDYPSIEGAKSGKCLTGVYDHDAALANKIAKLEAIPDGYVWHHVEDMKTMILVPQDVHSPRFHGKAHKGGASLIHEYLSYLGYWND